MTSLPLPPPANPITTDIPYRFWPRLGLFVLATVLFILSQGAGVMLLSPEKFKYLVFAATNGAAAFALAVLFLVHYRRQARSMFVGSILAKPLAIGAVAVIAAYGLCGLAISVLQLPQENFMAQLLAGIAGWQLVIKIASVIVLPPIAEELFFRHYVLRLFPYQKSTAWKWIAVIITSASFAAIHIQYGNWSTVVLIFAVSCIFAVARIVSGGLLVPILLHMLAEVVGLSSDWMFTQLGLYG